MHIQSHILFTYVNKTFKIYVRGQVALKEKIKLLYFLCLSLFVEQKDSLGKQYIASKIIKS